MTSLSEKSPGAQERSEMGGLTEPPTTPKSTTSQTFTLPSNVQAHLDHRQRYLIKDYQGHVFDIEAGRIEPVSRIVQQPVQDLSSENLSNNNFNRTRTQRFKLANAYDGYVTIDLLGTNCCLDVEANLVKSGTNIILWTKQTCRGKFNQQWKIVERGLNDNGEKLYSFHTRENEEFCLDVHLAKNHELVIWKFHGKSNQLFTCEEAAIFAVPPKN